MLASTTLAFLEESYKIYLLSRYVLHPPISKILTFAIIYPIIIISSLLLFHSFIYSLIHLFKILSLNKLPKFQFPNLIPNFPKFRFSYLFIIIIIISIIIIIIIIILFTLKFPLSNLTS